MSSIINADTSNGLKITSDTSGEIKLQSAGTDIVSVTANGMAVDTNTLYVDATNNRVGIGTSSPTNNLQIYNNGATNGQIHITNSSTGATATDGVLFGYDGSNDVLINNQEATAMKFYNNGTERMRIDSSGNLYVGTTTNLAGAKCSIYQNNAATSWAAFFRTQNALGCVGITNTSGTAGYTAIGFYNNGTSFSQVGSIGVSGSTTTYNTSSDYRLKENVAPMFGSIDRLKQLKPSTWSWVQDGSHGEGFLAHEAQEVVPEAISGTKDAVDDEGNPVYQGIDQSKLVPLLTAALQEAITKIEDLETRIQALENA